MNNICIHMIVEILHVTPIKHSFPKQFRHCITIIIHPSSIHFILIQRILDKRNIISLHKFLVELIRKQMCSILVFPNYKQFE